LLVAALTHVVPSLVTDFAFRFRLHLNRKESIMHLTHARPPEDSGSPAFACGNVLIPPTFDLGPSDVDSGASDLGEGTPLGWASAWIDLGGEG
jgi:hypothetical protein